jgi:ubiquinone/menaquinone biosynthesis C-methylase UbiE
VLELDADHTAHPRFSASRAFELNNPFRRLFDRSPQRFIKLLGIEPEWAIVDFGCGPGFFTVPFAKAARRVVAVDVQSEMLKKAEAYAGKAGVKIELAESDGSAIPFPSDSFDLVFLNLVYHEIEDKGSVLLEFLRLLKTGGKVAIREKTENTFFPIGPPVTPVSQIQDGLEKAGFADVQTIGGKGNRIVIGVKQNSQSHL